MNPRLRISLLALCIAFAAFKLTAQQGRIVIEGTASGIEAPTPVSLSGFTGEVLETLKFDLYVMGFAIVPESEAQYTVTGGNAPRVEARVKDKVGGGATLLARAYSNGTLRQQAHALADDIVKATVNREGIAQTKIAFRHKNGPRDFEIYVADYDGHNARAATSDKVLVAAPAWVKGRMTLFYSTYKNTFPDIVSHDLTTGRRQIFANHPGSNLSPAVSPDGRKVAMILSRGGSPDLWVADIDGQNLRQLTKTRESESSPTWGPDSRTICFSSEASGRSSLYTITTDGGAMKRLPLGGLLTEPDWSPDGRWIAFTRQSGNNFSIIIARPDGGGEQDLRVAGEDPNWAKNSRNLIFTRNQTRLSVLDVPTRQFKDIARVPGSSSAAAWAR
jgi:TolB protein